MSERLQAIYQVEFSTDSEVAGIAVADDLLTHIEEFIDQDEGDCVELIELIGEAEQSPAGQVAVLRNARNILLRTKTKDGYDIARSLDQVAWGLEHRRLSETTTELASYDWGKFMDVLKEVLEGGNPLLY